MKKTKQLSFIPKSVRFFGGQLLVGKRRSQRPISSKDSIHLVIRSSRAMGPWSFLATSNKSAIKVLLKRTADRYQIKVYRQALSGNHLHLIILIPSRKNYLSFVRVLSGQIAAHVMRGQSFKTFSKIFFEKSHEISRRNQPQSKRGDGVQATTYRPALEHERDKGQQFFNYRPFSRILNWGRDFKTCAGYLLQNKLEALGCIPYQPRSKHAYIRLLSAVNSSA